MLKRYLSLIIFFAFTILGVLKTDGDASNSLEQIPENINPVVRIEDPVIDYYFSQSMELVFHERFDRCLNMLDELKRLRPDHPSPYFLTAACYQMYMNTLRINRFTPVMEQNIELAIEKSRSGLKNKADAWLYLFMGASYGFRALNRFRSHHWFDALDNMIKSIRHLETALKLNPGIYDAFMGIGAYNYWRTARSKFIRTIAFWMADRRKIGLIQLRFVVDHGVYSVYEAGYNLIAAYIDHGMLDQAMALVDSHILKKGKPLTMDLYYKGRILTAKQNWIPSETIFRKLLQKLENEPLSSLGFRIECKYHIALSLQHQEKRAEALEIAEAALTECEHRDAGTEIENSFEPFNDMRSNLEKLADKLRNANTSKLP